MKRGKCDAGWAIEPVVARSDNIDFDQPTRIERMDFLQEKTAVSSGEYPKADSDATGVESLQGKRGFSTNRRTAEFRPRSGRRATGEVTIPWSSGGRDPAAVLKEKLARIRGALRARQRLIILGAMLALTSAAMLATINQNKVMDRESQPMSLSMGPKNSTGRPARKRVDKTHEKIATNRRGDENEANPSDERHVCLKDAVDALIDGHFKEALNVYKKLEASSPENESFSLAVEILSQSGKGAK
jgi:hypothetical protein